jgi:hypothetical protein
MSGTVPADGLLATLTIDTTGLTTGQFDFLLNPPATGPTAFADPGVTTTLTNGWLRIGAAPGPVGDYNDNGIVDAADYVLWRDSLNQIGPDLAADGNANNQIDPADYDVWRTHFGNASAAGVAAHSLAVPEPAMSTCLLSAVCLTMLPGRRPRRGMAWCDRSFCGT